MFRHIVVPLDGSQLAATAIPYAVALARPTDARISLLAVVKPLLVYAGLPSADAQEGDERHITESTAYLESVALPLRTSGLAVTAVVRHGDPAEAILVDIEDEEDALIVMSTHGRTGLERMRAGSVAQRVLRHASIPTLVVPPRKGASSDDAVMIAGITVPLDGSPLAEAALPIATRIATALSVPLTLFQAIPNIMAQASGWGVGYESYYPISEEMEHDEEVAVTEYLQTVATRLQESGVDVRTQWERSIDRRVEEVIAAYLAEQPSGIAVMASHGRSGVLRWALGSTAEGVLDQAPCPILIVRSGASTEDEPAR